jgi:tRNA/tmRNA/rRNA uracil-C5-methylase (TrmA/RlmC/RlmD family)
VRELFQLRVIEYQNDVSTEARALPSQLDVARLSRYPPAFERERKMSYEDYHGAGTFTRRLAGVADKVLALDVSSEAIAKARAAQSDLKQVEFRAGNIMEHNFRDDEPWDLM